MANLSYNEITRDGKEYRAELIVQKLFGFNDKTNNFVTDSGIFFADHIVVGTEKILSKMNVKEDKIKEVTSKILSLKGYPSSQRKVMLGGKFAGETQTKEIPVSKLEKSEEFGGQPAGGTRVNKGILFESHLEESLLDMLNGKKPKGKYEDQARKIIERTSKYIKSPVTEVKLMGGLNQSRPIASQSNQLLILPPRPQDHGQKLTDITLVHANGKESFLSLKFSSTLTFMNAGVGRFLSQEQIKKRSIKDPIGRAILDTFSLDEQLFCRVFNEYGKGTKFPNVKENISATKLSRFLSTCIGSDYWMVHGMEGGKIYFWHMSNEKNPQFSKVGGKIDIQYGGASGNGKRIDILFSNQFFDFKVNIRNKQSGLYPSHIMCDYKSKPATGKELL